MGRYESFVTIDCFLFTPLERGEASIDGRMGEWENGRMAEQAAPSPSVRLSGIRINNDYVIELEEIAVSRVFALGWRCEK
jgi:hypothetical protein